MPILAERQTAHTGSQSVDVIYLISAQNGLYGKEPFSVYLNNMKTSSVRCDPDFRAIAKRDPGPRIYDLR